MLKIAMQKRKKVFLNQKGASLVDYALITVLIAVAVISAIKDLRKHTQDAICSPVGGLQGAQTENGDSLKYHYDEELETCAPVQGNFYWN